MKKFLAICLSVILVGCSAIDGFTIDKSARLSFPSDTLKFDTVFGGLPSTTYTFFLANGGSDGLRINSASLRSGGVSGFRMLLDGQSGPSVAGIDVGKEDSVFLMVDLCPPINKGEIYSSCIDHIDFVLEGGGTQSLVLKADVLNANIVHDLSISRDTLIDSSQPLLVIDSIVVGKDASLELAPGTTLYFRPKAKMRVDGMIHVNGCLEHPVVFRGDRLDNLLSNLPYDRVSGQWGGVEISSQSYGNSFNYVDIHSSNYGIKCLPADTSKTKLTLFNSLIHNVKENCLELNDCSALIINSQISNAAGNCVRLNGGSAKVYHSTIAGFCPWSVSDVAFSAVPSERHNPTLELCNSIVTGYSDNELSLLYEDSVACTDLFSVRNSLIRVKSVSDSIFVDCVADVSDNAVSALDNFPLSDTKNYYYNFALSPDSKAVSLAVPWLLELCPFDRNGRKREPERIDAGCYQLCDDN